MEIFLDFFFTAFVTGLGPKRLRVIWPPDGQFGSAGPVVWAAAVAATIQKLALLGLLFAAGALVVHLLSDLMLFFLGIVLLPLLAMAVVWAVWVGVAEFGVVTGLLWGDRRAWVRGIAWTAGSIVLGFLLFMLRLRLIPAFLVISSAAELALLAISWPKVRAAETSNLHSSDQ